MSPYRCAGASRGALQITTQFSRSSGAASGWTVAQDRGAGSPPGAAGGGRPDCAYQSAKPFHRFCHRPYEVIEIGPAEGHGGLGPKACGEPIPLRQGGGRRRCVMKALLRSRTSLGRRLNHRHLRIRLDGASSIGDTAWVDLYWLPLGAGGCHCVRFNGRVYERFRAAREHGAPRDLYHSAVQLHLDGTTYALEMGPVWSIDAPERGVICRGAVGAAWLGRFRAFQYEVRCWPDGISPDLAEAVDSPQRVSDNGGQVEEVVSVLRQVPPLTWGRDDLRPGDMWNSNSLVSWALGRTRHDMGSSGACPSSATTTRSC